MNGAVDVSARDEPAPRGLSRLCLEICHGMWSVTPYTRCDLRCLYCCTSVQGASTPVVDVADLLRAARISTREGEVA
jgi:hypothetical protein